MILQIFLKRKPITTVKLYYKVMEILIYLIKIKKNLKSNSYLRFGPDINNSLTITKFNQNKELNELINLYLKFKSSIYLNNTWYNMPNTDFHYVRRIHRDYDDWKFLVVTIYWNDIDEETAPLGFLKNLTKTLFSKSRN